MTRSARLRVALISLDKDLLDLLECSSAFETVGVFDPRVTGTVHGVACYGPDSRWPEVKASDPALKAVLGVDPPRLRRCLAESYGLSDIVTVVAPDAYVAASSIVGPGSVVQRGVRILPDVRIGTACKLNVGASVHHDCALGDFSTLAPGARLLGHASVGEGCYIGASATVLPKLKVGDGATVGAGAVVTRDVPPGVVVVGVPARRMET